VLRSRPTGPSPERVPGECRERENPAESHLGRQRGCLAAACGSTLRPLAHRKTPRLSEASTSFRSSSPSPMKKLILSVLLALLAVAETFAQSSGTVPSATITPSHTTYSPAGGQIGFTVTLKYPSGGVPSLLVKPPGADWRFVGLTGPNVPNTGSQPGDSSIPSNPDSGFDFYFIDPPVSGSVSFSFVMSYPPGLTADPTVTFRANYSLNGANTIPASNVTLTPQGTATPTPVVFSILPVLAKKGDAVSFPVLFAGGAPFSFQWMKNGIDIPGANGAVFGIAKASAADALAYSVKIQAGGASVTSPSVGLSVLSYVSPIIPGRKFTVTGVNLPSYSASIDVDGVALLNPQVNGSAQTISADIPSSVVVNRAGNSVSLSIAGLGSVSFLIKYHDADTTPPHWSIGLEDLLRVIGFFNTKYTGSDLSVFQTGCYKVAPENIIDGFTVDSSRSSPAGQNQLARYHSSDTNKNGAIEFEELLRLIGLFNTRYTFPSTGDVEQTGFYRIEFGSVDGFAVDPQRSP